MLQAAPLTFIFKTPYHFSGDFFFFNCLELSAEGGPGRGSLSFFCVPWALTRTSLLCEDRDHIPCASLQEVFRPGKMQVGLLEANLMFTS